MPFLSFVHNRRGMALLYIVFIFIFIGVLVAAGAKMYGSIVARGKINDTKTGLENQVRMIVTWATTNGHLPAAGAEYLSVFGGTAPLDAWGRQIAYVYDDTLAVSATGGLCGRTSSVLQDSGTNIAFALVSGGEDAGIQTTVNGIVVTPPAKDVIGAAPQTLANYQSDLYRAVPLEEMKSKAGCYGPTGGKLTILNNELPRVCVNTLYNATVYGAGGVSFGATPYNWFIVNRGWLTPNTYDAAFTAGPTTLQLGGVAPAVSGTQSVTFRVQDADLAALNRFVERTYAVTTGYCNAAGTWFGNDATCGGGGCGGGSGSGIDTTPPVPGAPNNTSSNLLAANIITTTNATVPSTFSVNNNLIKFGDYSSVIHPVTPPPNSAGCIWYPYNFQVFGKTLRTFWNFCFGFADASSDSTTYADGYTFALMQGSNPTTYCGTGTTYNAVNNPYYDCSANWGGFGEYLAYCGLPGQNIATEFDIFPSGSRNDPAGNYNHVAIVQSHSGSGFPTGTYGDNTHGQGNNPACNNGTSATSGCIFSAAKRVTWLENGCNSTYDNHNARVEVHTRCNSTCSSCGTASCPSPLTAQNALVKVWIDKGNNNIASDDVTAADFSYCTTMNSAMDQIKAGFTQATGSSHQLGYIKNFVLNTYGSCSRPTLSPATLPTARVGSAYSQQMTAAGGTSPYTWGLSVTNIPGVAASTLPPGSPAFTINSSGLINGTPTTAGTYNTVLVSVTDSCSADVCANTSSMSYTINVCNSLSLPNTSLANGTAGTYQTWSVAGTGQAPLTYSLATGTLPPNLNLNTSTGAISGTPTTAGTYNFAIALADGCGSGGTVQKAYSIQVNGVPPTCTLTANPNAIQYNTNTTLTWTISNGPANGSWSGSPGNTCTNFSNSSGGNCTTSNRTTTGANTFTLTVSNAYGSNICSATPYVGCAGYQVFNNTGARYDFIVTGSTCNSHLKNGNEITNGPQLNPGDTITRYGDQSSCTGQLGQINYSNAMNVDIVVNGGNGNCQVDYNAGNSVGDH